MDKPAMLTRKHVPEDVGLRNTGEDKAAVTAGGQGQMHRDQKQHKPVLKKVKEKVKKIKSTLASGHGHGGEERAGYDAAAGGSNSSEEGEEDAADREAALEKGGYMEDVEDKPVLTESDDPEVHGAPRYESERAQPAVQDLVAKYDPARAPAAQEDEGGYGAPRVRFRDLGGPGFEDHAAPVSAAPSPASTPAVQEAAEGDAAPRVRLGDLGGPVVEDPAAPLSTTPAAREGEDIGTTPVVQQFETMNLSDDHPAHVGAEKKDAKAEESKDAAADKMSGGGASYTDKLRSAAAGTTEYGKKLATTVYEKVAGGGTGRAVGAGKRDGGERTETAPAPPASNDASTAMDAGTTEELKYDAPVATDARNGSSGAGYTNKIKSAATGTAGYGKQLASTAYEKVAGVAPNLRPQVGAESKPAEDAHARSEAMPVSDAAGAGADEEWKDAPAATDDTAAGTDVAAASGGPGYTDKIKSAAAGTTEYGKQLASTVYEKVTGAGTAVAGKVQQATRSAGTATPGFGAQAQQDAGAAANTPGAGGQDKGVTVTGYIAEKLRPGDEDRALSEAISGTVQRRKDDAGGTVAQRVPAPGQVVATGEEVKESYGAEAPVIHGEEIGDRRLNTNTM